MSAKIWDSRRAAKRNGRKCRRCEWTPGGWFAYPCRKHSCPACHHVRHSAGDGCGQPDPRTGWCECEAGS
jgi:hypothetical protein